MESDAEIIIPEQNFLGELRVEYKQIHDDDVLTTLLALMVGLITGNALLLMGVGF